MMRRGGNATCNERNSTGGIELWVAPWNIGSGGMLGWWDGGALGGGRVVGRLWSALLALHHQLPLKSIDLHTGGSEGNLTGGDTTPERDINREAGRQLAKP